MKKLECSQIFRFLGFPGQTQLRSRFESTFARLHDLIGARYGEEVTGIETLCLLARAGIEDCEPILKPLFLKPVLTIGPDQAFTASKSMDPVDPIQEENFVLKGNGRAFYKFIFLRHFCPKSQISVFKWALQINTLLDKM